MADAIGLVRQFFDSWSESAAAVNRSIVDHFTADTVWDDVGLARTVGPDEAVAFLKRGRSRPGSGTRSVWTCCRSPRTATRS